MDLYEVLWIVVFNPLDVGKTIVVPWIFILICPPCFPIIKSSTVLRSSRSASEQLGSLISDFRTVSNQSRANYF